MRALVATAYGEIDKLEVREMPEPVVKYGEVKVKVHAASLNPVDWKLLAGHARALMELKFPAILGRDAAGEVVEIGEGVKGLRVGERVLGLAMGTFAERVVAAENAWAALPANLDLADAAALPLVTLTGAQLADRVSPQKGKLILVTGAVGGVGRTAIFVAKSLGATVWAGVRASQKLEANTLGADEVIAIDDEREVARLPELDAVCDTVGGETIARIIPRIKKGGVLASVLGEPPGAKQRGVEVRAFRTEPDPGLLAELAQAAARGKLVIPVGHRLPLAQAREAFQLAQKGGGGKVLLLL